MTMLRFRPVWNGVDVVRWLEEARWRLGVWAESSSLERSLELGVEEKVAGGDLIVTLFLIGELCLAPDGFLCLFEVFSEDGRDLVLLRGGVGVVRAELGVLEAWPDTCWIFGWGLTGTTWDCGRARTVLNGLIGLEWPTPGLTRERGSAELGVSRNMARLDTVGVILEEGV